MRKNIWNLIFAFALCFMFSGCDSILGASSGLIRYTITFKQSGCKDIVKTVNGGGALAEIPMPADKTGYTITWDKMDFTNIKEDIIVNAVETANTYTITYDANGGMMDSITQEVTFDSDTTLAVPQWQGYIFLCWYYDGGAVVDGKWTIANDITLVAQWQDVREGYTISFVQAGCQVKVFTVKEGESLTEIPAPALKTGHTVVWDRTDFTNIQQNITVTAIETPKTYTVSFNANGGADLSQCTVVYGQEYTLPTPTHTDEKMIFEGWMYDGKIVKEDGEWNIDVDGNHLELNAVWSSEQFWTGGR